MISVIFNFDMDDFLKNQEKGFNKHDQVRDQKKAVRRSNQRRN